MQSVTSGIIAVMNRLNKMNVSSSNMSLFCNVCQVPVSSESVMEVHVKGKKHCRLEQIQRHHAASAAQSVCVQGLPVGSTVDQLTEFFQQFGTVNKVILDREHGHYALIEFNEDSTAKSILSKSSVLMNNSRLTIRPRNLKGIQPKRKARRGPECLPQKHPSTVTLATTAPAAAINFEEIIEKLKECSSLEEEMNLLMKEASLSSEEIAIRQKILMQLETVIQQGFCPDCQVHLFGSSVNGLGTKGCDLDLFLDLRLDESSSHISTFSKMDCQFGHENIPTKHISQDSIVPANNDSMTCDDSVTCDDSSKCENNDSVTGDNDTSTENGISRKEEEHKTLYTKSLQKSIKKISNLFYKRKDVYTQIVVIKSARCPVVKFLHLSTLLKCDLSFNNRLALRNTSLIQFLLSVDSRIRPLVFSIRHWAKVRGVAGQLNAGVKLTNYALTMIVFFYLQTRSPPILPSIDKLSQLAESRCIIEGWDCSFMTDITGLEPEGNISHQSNSEDEEKKSEERAPMEELLLGFFEFYAKLDFSLNVICLRSGKCVDLNTFSEQMTSDARVKDFKIAPLMVRDPFVLNHNVASNINEKSLLHLQTELKAAATKCSIHRTTSATAGCSRPSLIPLFSSEPTNPLIHSPAPHQREMPPTASQCQGTRGGENSFTVKVEASKLMAEALRRKKTFAEMQDGWFSNVVTIVRHTLKIFDIQSGLVEQPELYTEGSTSEDGAASCIAKSPCDADELQTKSSAVGERMIQYEKASSGLANKLLDSSKTQDNESCSHDRTEICPMEDNNCRKRYSSEHGDGKELKRYKSGYEPKDSTASSSKQNDSTENDDSTIQNNSGENMEKDPVECVNATDETSNTEQNIRAPSQIARPLISATCLAHSRLWMGRKKVRKQLSSLDISDYEKEVQVSRMLSSQSRSLIQKDEGGILKFEIFLSAENSLSTALTVSMEKDADEKSKELSPFFFSFRSVVERLVDKYGMEDIGEWKLKA